MKASASEEHGYQLLITDLKSTYFCTGDKECIKNEKKVFKQFLITHLDVQPDDKNGWLFTSSELATLCH